MDFVGATFDRRAEPTSNPRVRHRGSRDIALIPCGRRARYIALLPLRREESCSRRIDSTH